MFVVHFGAQNIQITYKVLVLGYFSNVGILQEKLTRKKDLESRRDPSARKNNVSDHAGLARYQTPIMFIENQIWKCELEINI